MTDRSEFDDMPWWRPAMRRAVRWLVWVALGSAAAAAVQLRLVDWLWTSETQLRDRLWFLAWEIYVNTALMSWLATLSALAFGLWVFERECRKEVRKVRDEAAVELHQGWEEELARRSAEIRSGEEIGVPAEKVLERLYAEMEEERDED